MTNFKIRPNYYFFTGAIIVYVFGLMLVKAWLASGLCLLAAFLIHLATVKAPADRVGKLEGWSYLAIMSVFFFATTLTVPMIRPEIKFDGVLQQLDWQYLAPAEKIVAEYSAPMLTDMLTFCYLLYGPMMYSSIIYFAFFRKDLGLPYFAGLFSIFGLGFIGYLAVPAEGPHFARLAEVMPLIKSGPFHTFADPLIKGGCTRSDAFPSLHVAVSIFSLTFMFLHTRRLFFWWLIPVTGLCLATVYLFYHYQVDILAGLGLAVAAVALSQKSLSTIRSIKEGVLS